MKDNKLRFNVIFARLLDMQTKRKKAIFICQIGENVLKVIKCILNKNQAREISDLEAQPISPETDASLTSGQVKKILDRLEYRNEPLLVSLPRNQATCKYISVPSGNPQEIARIISLQASALLPYPEAELITGYQTISPRQESSAHINLTVAHQDVITRYLKILDECGVKNFSIILSTYGLSNLYDYIRPQDANTAMVIDIDSDQVELAIVAQRKMLFSQHLKINKLQPDWESLFIEEVKKTCTAYLNEIVNQPLDRIILLGSSRVSQECIKILNEETKLAVETLTYIDTIGFSGNALQEIRNSEVSFASLIGLGLKDTGASLNLLPRNITKEAEGVVKQKEYLRLSLFFLGTMLILGLSISKGVNNKQNYLRRLKTELNQVSQEAGPLEEKEKALKLLEGRAQNAPAGLEVLSELHRIMPEEVSLSSLIYEEDNQIILRGETLKMNSVLTLVAALEKSAVIGDWYVRLRYATKTHVSSGESMGFEIVCAKK